MQLKTNYSYTSIQCFVFFFQEADATEDSIYETFAERIYREPLNAQRSASELNESRPTSPLNGGLPVGMTTGHKTNEATNGRSSPLLSSSHNEPVERTFRESRSGRKGLQRNGQQTGMPGVGTYAFGSSNSYCLSYTHLGKLP